MRGPDDGRVQQFRALRVEHELNVITAAILGEHREFGGNRIIVAEIPKLRDAHDLASTSSLAHGVDVAAEMFQRSQTDLAVEDCAGELARRLVDDSLYYLCSVGANFGVQQITIN